MLDLLILALLGGLGLAIGLSILGNFIVWNKMSYIGDSIAHSSLLGLVLAIFIPIYTDILLLGVCFIGAFLLILFNKRFGIEKGSLLVVNTQLSLALGIIIMSLFGSSNLLTSYFFGNIFGLDFKSVTIIYMVLLGIILYVFFSWDKLILISISEEIYSAENNKPFYIMLFFTFVLSVIIVYAIKAAGLLLIPSLIIVPSLIAVKIAKTPLQSIFVSAIAASFATIIGILLSTVVDVPTGALITALLISMLLLKFLYLSLRKLV